jgi:hypothetical protein
MTDNRRTGLWMIALAITSIASWMLTDVPDIGETNDQALAFYAAGPGPMMTIVGFYLGLLSVVCVFAWLAAVRRWLEREGGRLPEVGHGAATGYATLVVAAGGAFLLPTAYDRLGFGPAHGAGVDPLFLRTAAAMGDGLILIAAPVLLAIVIAVVCRAMSGTHLIHHWVAVSGYVVAALLLVGWTWFPMMLFFLWALVVGIALALPHPQAERSREAMTEPHQA